VFQDCCLAGRDRPKFKTKTSRPITKFASYESVSLVILRKTRSGRESNRGFPDEFHDQRDCTWNGIAGIVERSRVKPRTASHQSFLAIGGGTEGVSLINRGKGWTRWHPGPDRPLARPMLARGQSHKLHAD